MEKESHWFQTMSKSTNPSSNKKRKTRPTPLPQNDSKVLRQIDTFVENIRSSLMESFENIVESNEKSRKQASIHVTAFKPKVYDWEFRVGISETNMFSTCNFYSTQLFSPSNPQVSLCRLCHGKGFSWTLSYPTINTNVDSCPNCCGRGSIDLCQMEKPYFIIFPTREESIQYTTGKIGLLRVCIQILL